MIKITKNSKIYIYTPANACTGGPEYLHQLGKGLKDFGHNVFMYYIPTDNPVLVHKEYKHYEIPFTNKVDDEEDNIIIVPELYNYIILLKDINKAQKIILWLSVDNFYVSYFLTKNKILGIIIRIINKITKHVIKKTIINLNNLALKKNINYNLIEKLNINLHLVQSEYAKQNLQDNGIENIKYLFDYIKNDYNTINKYNIKENTVLFNPKKGVEFTKKIIKKAPQINFIPIENMSHNDVIELMKKSKVYIDFGNHPGQDRIPREAALYGCCIITGKKGSAFYFKDVPIPDKYKFEDKEYLIPQIIKTIEQCLKDFDFESKNFNFYRNIIKNSKIEFDEQLKNIFKIE